MKTEELVKKARRNNILPQWQQQFAHFVETGEASEEFLNYLNSNQQAQQAVEAAFNAQAEAFQSLARELKCAQELEQIIESGKGGHSREIAEAVDLVIENASRIPRVKRIELIQQRTASLPVEQLQNLAKTLGGLFERSNNASKSDHDV